MLPPLELGHHDARVLDQSGRCIRRARRYKNKEGTNHGSRRLRRIRVREQMVETPLRVWVRRLQLHTSVGIP